MPKETTKQKMDRRSDVKSKALPVAIFVAIVGCVLAVSANVTTSKIQQDLEQERYKRFHAEEQVQNMQAELAASQSKIAGIEQILNTGATASEDFKSQLDSLTQERDSLLQEIKQLKSSAQPSGTTTEPATSY